MQTMNNMRRHEVETFSILLVLCEGNSPFSGVFPSQRSSHAERWCLLWSTPEKRLDKQWSWSWFEPPWRTATKQSTQSTNIFIGMTWLLFNDDVCEKYQQLVWIMSYALDSGWPRGSSLLLWILPVFVTSVIAVIITPEDIARSSYERCQH